MNAFGNTCIELRKQDRTLSEIMLLTGRSRSSVFFHIRDIPLSVEKQYRIKQNTQERARALALTKKGKSIRNFHPFLKWDTNSVCLVAHLLFDGEINQRGCMYNNRNEVLLKRVEGCMQKIYPFEPKRYLNTSTGVYRISYFNVVLGAYMQHKSQELLQQITTSSKECKRTFLRAFFDDEGCMDFRPTKNRRSVRGYQKNIKILQTVQSLLKDMGITASLKLPNEVVITSKVDLEKFQQEINFSAGVCINGKRSNSVWKEHLEKRELLSRALHSFKQ